MKKLMIAASAALIATVGFSLESANVVGYASGATTSGNKIMGAQFAAVAGEGIDLTDIIVTGYNTDDGTEAEVKVQTLDARGRGGMTYSFYDVPGELYGWLDSFDNPVEPGTVILLPAEGLWVNAPNENFSLQTAGQVPNKGYAITLTEGNKMVVNTTPVAVDLNNIQVKGYNLEDGTEAEVKVQTLDYRGRGGMTYSFYDVPGELFGWLDSFDNPVEDEAMMIQPGEGLWVSAPSTSFQMELPGVTL